MISEDDVEKLANLARLEIEGSLKAVMAEQVNSILEYVKQLEKVDTSNVAPMSHTNQSTNVMREDAVCLSGSQAAAEPLGEKVIPPQEMLTEEDLYKNAPDRSGRYIRVPLIVE